MRAVTAMAARKASDRLRARSRAAGTARAAGYLNHTPIPKQTPAATESIHKRQATVPSGSRSCSSERAAEGRSQLETLEGTVPLGAELDFSRPSKSPWFR